jgi:hypothetical protein
LVAKLAGEPFGLGNEVDLLVETDKGRGLPGIELLAKLAEVLKTEGDRRHAPSQKLDARDRLPTPPHASSV